MDEQYREQVNALLGAFYANRPQPVTGTVFEDGTPRDGAEASRQQDEFTLWYEGLTEDERALIDAFYQDDQLDYCQTHGVVEVTGGGNNEGFAGEGFCWLDLSCGCVRAEEGDLSGVI